MKEKLVAFKDKVLDFVDAVKEDPRKQVLVVAVMAFVLGFGVAKLA